MGLVKSNPRIRRVTITPELAAKWLESNTHNRDLSDGWVSELASAIKRGEWHLNNDAIAFDTNDVLQNGQHRLWAIVESGTAVDAIVVEGLEPPAQDTMDLGRKRNLGATLKLRGEVNQLVLAAGLVLYWRLLQGNELIRTTKQPSIAQALAVLKKNPSLRDAVKQGQRLRSRLKVSPSVATVCWYQYDKLDDELAEHMWERLIDGQGLREGDPILVLRQWILRQNNQGAGAKASTLMVHALFNKAWNALRDGKRINSLNWRTAGPHAETFPLPR